MIRRLEESFSRISNMNLAKKIKIFDWNKNVDPSIWVDADFNCMNIALDDPIQKTNLKNVALGPVYNMVKLPYYESPEK